MGPFGQEQCYLPQIHESAIKRITCPSLARREERSDADRNASHNITQSGTVVRNAGRESSVPATP
ncbi:hypothetical protein DN051_36105 [Streptomyces cadmiisoli]|uniref:Uncharacterized protein n=1 Tax=Streptomyces cadmiisoli TaxID=2184053 RepID=A0A2Z4J918_9ACTN|nr:hypothetical protein DN051_36105 [Streptomyces cadmiisoli]